MEQNTTTWGAFMQRCSGHASAAVADIQGSRMYQVVLAVVAVCMMSLMLSADAFAQTTDNNPFREANDELLQFGTYGLVAGGVIMGIIVGVRAGKAIYKTLSS